MANISVKEAVGGRLDISVNDQAVIRRYEKACSLDEKKIVERIERFLSESR